MCACREGLLAVLRDRVMKQSDLFGHRLPLVSKASDAVPQSAAEETCLHM
jgi:hypothetical protein